MTFYLLSLLTGVLECGWIAYGAVHSLPLWQILCYPLAYHLGNLFPKPFSLSNRCLGAMALTSLVTSALTFATGISDMAVFILTCISLFLISTVFQSVRSGLKSDGNRLLKRVFRVGGFALAPLAAVLPSVVLFITALVAICSLNGYRSRYCVSRVNWQGGFSLVMVFHQLHYFFYAHITLAVISIALLKQSSYGALCAALLFCGTWITYMSVEPLLSKLTKRVTLIFYAGHIAISALLCLMSFVTGSKLFIALWLVTGFGGGAVYTISAKARATGMYDKTSMTVSENVGHTLGLLSAVIVAAIAPALSLRVMLILGAISAALAVASMIFTNRRDKKL